MMHQYGFAQRHQTRECSIRKNRVSLHHRSLVSRRRCLTCVAGADKLLVAALDKALTQITRILVEHEQQKQRKQLQSGSKQAEIPGKAIRFRAGSSGERQVQEVLNPSTGQGGDQQQPRRGFREYLALPLDQYSVLDPSWISRPDPVNQPDTFLLKVPLSDMMYVRLEPQVTIKVDIEPERSQVQFHATSFQVGDERFDSSFNLNMTAVLSHKPISDVTAMGQSMAAAWKWLKQDTSSITTTTTTTTNIIDNTQSVADSQAEPKHSTNQEPNVSTDNLEAGFIDVTCDSAPASRAAVGIQMTTAAEYASSGSNSSSNVDVSLARASSLPVLSSGAPGQQDDSSQYHSNSITGATSQQHDQMGNVHDTVMNSQEAMDSAAPSAMLRCNVDMEFNVIVPSPLSVVPGPLLSAAGSLLARFCVQNMLPGFLELLSVDYGRWATGAARGQKVGSLISTTNPPASLTAPLPLSSDDIGLDVTPGSQLEPPTQHHQSPGTAAACDGTSSQPIHSPSPQLEDGRSNQQGAAAAAVVDVDVSSNLSNYGDQQTTTQSLSHHVSSEHHQNSLHETHRQDDEGQGQAVTEDQHVNRRADPVAVSCSTE